MRESLFKSSLVPLLVLSMVLMTAPSGSARHTQVGVSRDPGNESSLHGDQPGEEVREEFHQSHPLSANGRVSLENLNGNVRIAVWDRQEVKIDAVKRAYRRDRLNEARIEVGASPDAIRIKTVYPDWNQTFTDDMRGRYNNPANVDYSLTVPRKARLESVDLINGSLEVDGVEGDVKASSVNGRVIARGLLGSTKLSTINNALEATFTTLDETKPISLSSVNGPLVLIIPSNANAIVRANTVHGGITSQFGIDVKHGEYVGHDLYGQIGTGGPRIRLGNVNGHIAIKHAQDGRPLSPATSLISEKEKEKEKEKALEDREQARESAEARRAERAEQRERVRSEREIQVEVEREVQRAMREAQRELQQAEREIQREAEREMREKMRRDIRGEGPREGEGAGQGKGTGKGVGKGTGYRTVTLLETKTFPVTGSPRVNIVTFDGEITVHGWDKQEISYKATKRGSDEQEVKHVVIETQQQGPAFSIIARSEHGIGSASLEVYVPRSSTVHISSEDGNLKLEGISGELMLRTGDGSIEVTDARGQLQLNTGDGHIRVTNFDGQVDARTGDGAINLDGKFSGLAARTGDGEISLSVPANSDFTIETNAEELDHSGISVSEDVAPSKRVRRWKVGRGGNIFVLNTGDGRVAINVR